MDIVAEVGLEGLNMRLLGDRVQLKAPVMYAVFPSKDELLYRCFLFVNRQIADLFKDTSISPDATKEEVLEYIHAAWLRYFRFMVDNGSRSMYYYAYRDSARLKNILMQNNTTVAQDMTDFTNTFTAVAEKLGMFDQLSPDLFYVYLLDGTGNFVRRIIRDKLTPSEQEEEAVWRLLTCGFLGFSGK